MLIQTARNKVVIILNSKIYIGFNKYIKKIKKIIYTLDYTIIYTKILNN